MLRYRERLAREALGYGPDCKWARLCFNLSPISVPRTEKENNAKLVLWLWTQ